MSRPRLRRAVLVGGGLACLGAAAALGFALAPGGGRPVTVTLTAPVAVVPVPLVTPSLPAAQVTLAPEPQVTIEEEPQVMIEEEPAPAARPAHPLLHAGCLVLDDGAEPLPSCAADEGFPAVSADATRVATRYGVDDGGRGNPNLRIHIIDVATGRVVDDLLVLSPDEYDLEDRAALRATVERRAAAIQRRLDQGGYRTMAWLGDHAEEIEWSNGPRSPGAAARAEIDGEQVRAVAADGRLLWQERFSAPAPVIEPDQDFCAGWYLLETSVWWDAPTRVVVATQLYRTGGCLCSDEPIEHVRRTF